MKMGLTTMADRVRARLAPGPGIRGDGSGTKARGDLPRILALVLMVVLLVPGFMALSSAPAFAETCGTDSAECNDYSLYKLASDASSYFGEANSPESDGIDAGAWNDVTSDPASAGSLLGYADPEFSLFNVVGWLFSEVSGSSQTMPYDIFSDLGNDDISYSGMVDYAHFGAANRDLGLDTMGSGVNPIGPILAAIGGSVIWLLYALALFVSMAFGVIVGLLKLANPFSWFFVAIFQINMTFGLGMVCSEQDGATTCSPGSDGPLAGLQYWIADWYGVLNSMAWQVLVPLFVAFTVLGLLLFKRMDRGGAIRKLIVRLCFIGFGVPLLGSMYTGVLNQFDDTLLGSNAGPTRVVLSTYVDFESWMMNDRLAVPDEGVIGWENGQASPAAMMSVRNTALAINRDANPAFGDISITGTATDAAGAWKSNPAIAETCEAIFAGVPFDECETSAGDWNMALSAFGVINRYIGGEDVKASDFENGIKTSVHNADDLSADDRMGLFVKENRFDFGTGARDLDYGYGEVEGFGEGSLAPGEHEIISSSNGLTSSNPGGSTTTFTTGQVAPNCGFTVTNGDGAPAACNLSPLSAFNYLNTSFGPESMTLYSSNNAANGALRETHMAVSQVGTGPAKFMYWHNAATVLGAIVIVGFWYALGMLVGAVKRTFSLVAAIPFATIGSMAAIAKVIVYTVALIMEVIVTLFMYQFVSEFLISTPGIISGPISLWIEGGGSALVTGLQGIAVVVLTLISSLIVTFVAIALLRVRKVVLQAMDEVFTKLVDKFLETNTPPSPRTNGLMPALASGVGSGVGMAAGNKLSNMSGNMLGGKNGGSNSPKQPTPMTNAGGTYGPQGPKAIPAGEDRKQIEGPRPGGEGPDGLPPGSGPDGPNQLPPGGDGGTDTARTLPGGEGPDGSRGKDGKNADGQLALPSGKGGSVRSAKETAQQLSSKGGLSDLGFTAGSPGTKGKAPSTGTGAPMQMEKGPDGVFRPVGGAKGEAGSSAPITGPASPGSGKRVKQALSAGNGAGAPTQPVASGSQRGAVPDGQTGSTNPSAPNGKRPASSEAVEGKVTPPSHGRGQGGAPRGAAPVGTGQAGMGPVGQVDPKAVPGRAGTPAQQGRPGEPGHQAADQAALVAGGRPTTSGRTGSTLPGVDRQADAPQNPGVQNRFTAGSTAGEVVDRRAQGQAPVQGRGVPPKGTEAQVGQAPAPRTGRAVPAANAPQAGMGEAGAPRTGQAQLSSRSSSGAPQAGRPAADASAAPVVGAVPSRPGRPRQQAASQPPVPQAGTGQGAPTKGGSQSRVSTTTERASTATTPGGRQPVTGQAQSPTAPARPQRAAQAPASAPVVAGQPQRTQSAAPAPAPRGTGARGPAVQSGDGAKPKGAGRASGSAQTDRKASKPQDRRVAAGGGSGAAPAASGRQPTGATPRQSVGTPAPAKGSAPAQRGQQKPAQPTPSRGSAAPSRAQVPAQAPAGAKRGPEKPSAQTPNRSAQTPASGPAQAPSVPAAPARQRPAPPSAPSPAPQAPAALPQAPAPSRPASSGAAPAVTRRADTGVHRRDDEPVAVRRDRGKKEDPES